VNILHGSMQLCASNKNLRQIRSVKRGLVMRLSTQVSGPAIER
jgi:hypothetical protein